jgi:glutamyl/glutaminyl-tRNA synthetase
MSFGISRSGLSNGKPQDSIMRQENLKVRVRFAPSPTGFMHIGGVRTALFNYLFAKNLGGEFLLRIEDTDQKRLVKEAEEVIYSTLEWLGLRWEGKIVRQSERLESYKKYADELLDKKIAHKKDGAVWVKLPEDKKFTWNDLVGNKTISFMGKDVDEFVILKSDGFPTYHLANVVDDPAMEITHVLRGEEWISSTPKHLYLYECLGLKRPEYAHLPVILGPDHSKLSKRHGAKSVFGYREEGFIKEAILNFIALLGWNPGGDKEQMSLSEMTKLFKLEDINTANPIFDVKKMEWLNGVWLRGLPVKDVEKRLEDFYVEESEVLEVFKSPKKDVLIKAAVSRMRTLADFKYFTSEEPARKKTKEEAVVAKKLLEFLSQKLSKNNWENEKLLASLKEFSKAENVPFKTIYFLLSGKEQGIGLLELNEIHGKDFFVKILSNE